MSVAVDIRLGAAMTGITAQMIRHWLDLVFVMIGTDDEVGVDLTPAAMANECQMANQALDVLKSVMTCDFGKFSTQLTIPQRRVRALMVYSHLSLAEFALKQ